MSPNFRSVQTRSYPLQSRNFQSRAVRWLVEHGAKPNARCKFDITPLSIAATSGSYEVISLLFEFGA